METEIRIVPRGDDLWGYEIGIKNEVETVLILVSNGSYSSKEEAQDEAQEDLTNFMRDV